ncbi:MAG: CAP domain-containing protein [Candidatus Brocadiia bacterium]
MARWPSLPLLLLVSALAVRAAEAEKGGEELSPIEKLERQMAELVNRDRRSHDLPPYDYHPRLAEVARAHSRDMYENGFVGHHSKTTGSPKDRVEKARIPNRGVGENIAAAPNVRVGEAWLMRSPKHRENILHEHFTHVGIGAVEQRGGHLLITQLFIRQPPMVDVAAVRGQILEGINEARLEKGRRRLVEDEQLTRDALAHSRRAARLGEHQPLWLEERLARDHARWSIHEARYFLTDRPADVVASAAAMHPRYDHVGVAVVQAPPDSKARGALWVTLICAQAK